MTMSPDPVDPADGVINSLIAGLSFLKPMIELMPPSVTKGAFASMVDDAEKEMELFLIDRDFARLTKVKEIMSKVKDYT